MNKFVSRIIGLALVLGSLCVYQVTGTVREKDDEIARLTAESVKNEAELAAAQSEIAALTASSDSGSGTEEAGQYKDGSYNGEAEGFGGPISLTVTVSGGKITDITVNSHEGEDPAFYSNAEAIIGNIIDAQSADVDTISGATFSSTGIKNAVAEALKEASA